MARPLGWLLFGAAAVAGCRAGAEPATQLIVAVSADEVVAPQLARLSVLIYPAGPAAEEAPVVTASFPLAVSTTEEGEELRLPLSFGVAGSGGDKVLLVVQGHAERAARAPVVVEQKQLVRFRSRTALGVEVFLSSACLEAGCDRLDRTCYPEALAGVEAGACGRVLSSAERPTVPGQELDGVTLVPAGMREDAAVDDEDAGSALDAAADAGADAELGDADQPDTGALSVELGVPLCSFESSCGDPAYPCVAREAAGYSCLGQFAEWRMPADTAQGGKVAADYDASSSTTVTVDRVTDLLWEAEVPATYPGCSGKRSQLGDGCTWDEAARYCAARQLGGQTARLPSKIELESLIDESVRDPALDRVAFFATYDGEYWTRSPVAGAENEAWTVDAADGNARGRATDTAHRVRCVRSRLAPTGEPRDRYALDSVLGTVTDTSTTLTWQRSDTCSVSTWDAAKAVCASAGASFRLPTRKELLTLVDPTRRDPALEAHFVTHEPRANVWTASASLYERGAWRVQFSDGSSSDEALLGLFPPAVACVRCVR